MEKRELTDVLYRELVILERVMQEPSIIIDDKTGKVEQIDNTKQIYYQIGRVLMAFRDNYRKEENIML